MCSVLAPATEPTIDVKAMSGELTLESDSKRARQQGGLMTRRRSTEHDLPVTQN